MSRQALRLVRSKSMLDKPKKLRIFAESGPLIALAIAAGMVLGIVGPSSAQFFNFGGFQQRPQPQRGGGGFGGGWFGNDSFEPLQQRAPQPRWDRRQTPPPVREDFSKAPPPEKRETVPERQILVLGDAMADWLAYGLEEAYSEQPDMGVVRKHKTVSGLIRYQPKGDPADWAAAAKGVLAIEKPDAIVVMLGLDDRMPMREPAAEKTDGKSAADNKVDKKDNKKDAKAKPGGKPTGKPDDKPADAELSPGDAPGADQPPVIVPEKRARSPDGVYFTKAGARKLAHYVEREINRLLAARSAPIALPTEPATPDANALPGQPAPRPLAGPILPLVDSSVGTDQLLGGPGSRPAAVDALAARVLVKGEPLPAPAGRADDFVWPRREVRREQAKGETPVASASPDGRVPVTASAASLKPKKHRRPSGGQGHLSTVARGMAREPALARSNLW